MAGRRLVVLGADGFIGSDVVRTALAADAEVTGLCVKTPWRLEAGAHDGLRLEPVAGGRWWEAPFEGPLAEQLRGASALVHLGYEPPPRDSSPEARAEHELEVNAGGSERVAAVAAAAGVPVVFASSADVYGPWLDAPATEDTECAPATPYGKAKLAAEAGLPPGTTILRLSTVFGPGELGPRAIPMFIRAALTGGRAMLHGGGRDVKDYVRLGAVAAAFVAAAAEPPAASRVLNVASGTGRSTADVLAAVGRALGTEPAAENVESPREPGHLVVSPERARRELGFDPDADFEAELRAEAAWLDANRARWE